jgi:hypothetical protein
MKLIAILGMIDALRQLSMWISEQIAIAKQNKELTPEQAAELEAKHKEVMTQEQWTKPFTKVVLFLLVPMLFFASPSFAQEVTTNAPAAFLPTPENTAIVEVVGFQVLTMLLAKFGTVVVALLSIIGALRVIMKPINLLAEWWVARTPSKKDD